MQAIASTRCTVLAARPAVVCQARRSSSLRVARLVVRAEQEKKPETPAAAPSAPSMPAAPAAAAVVVAEPFSILNVQQEAINGRAAMLGFVIAIGTELASGQSVWSQIAGKYVDQKQVEAPHGFSTLAFFFVVVMLSFATFAPKVFKDESLTSRSVGPFTPAKELINGRAAMLGFVALLVAELVKGSALF